MEQLFVALLALCSCARPTMHPQHDAAELPPVAPPGPAPPRGRKLMTGCGLNAQIFSPPAAPQAGEAEIWGDLGRSPEIIFENLARWGAETTNQLVIGVAARTRHSDLATRAGRCMR